jgi:rhomboid protease GluP
LSICRHEVTHLCIKAHLTRCYTIHSSKRGMMRISQIAVTAVLLFAIIIVQLVSLAGGSFGQLVWDHLDIHGWQQLYNQPWRILTSPFLHQDFLHFLGNAFFLAAAGWQIERKYGWKLFLAIFFGALITSYVFYINLAHDHIIGISGGLFGLYGFLLVADRQRPWWTTFSRNPLLGLITIGIPIWIMADLFDWVSYPIAHLLHLVGLLYGLAFGSAFLLLPPEKSWARVAIIALPITLFISQLYSPWQIEWRLLRHQETLTQDVEECRNRSAEQDVLISSEIEFVNKSTKPAAIYWLDYEGDPVFQLWLKQNKTMDWNSYIGHFWCAVDPEREGAPNIFIVSEAEQTFTIR